MSTAMSPAAPNESDLKRTQSAEEDVKEGGISASAAEALRKGKVHDTRLAEAIAASEFKPLGKSAIQLYLCLAVAFMASVQNGFDGSIMSNINAMHQYLDFFGYKQSGPSTGFVFVSYNIGNVIGAVVAGPICDYTGRRGGLAIYASIILLAASLSAASQNRAWFVGTRILLGVGISLATTAAPVYVTELAPPQWRGRCVGAYNSCYFIGSILVSGVMVGTTHIQSTAAWRIPLGMQNIPAVIVVIAVWFIPESPRWLAAKGRMEEAEAIFARLHGNGDPENALVQLQMEEIKQSLIETASEQALRWWDFACLFNSHQARWRTLQVTLMCFAGQWTGNGIGYFYPVLYAGAGITSQSLQLILSFVNSICSAFGASLGTAVADHVGRRPRLIYGTAWITVTMVAAFALTHVFGKGGEKYSPDGTSGANAGILFLFVYGVSFAIIYTPLQSLFCSECLSNGTRAKGMAYHTLVVNVALIVNTFGISVALAKIGNYVYLIYVAWCAIETVIWYFLGVETRGRSLEELDEIFEAPNPVKASKVKPAIGRRARANEGVESEVL